MRRPMLGAFARDDDGPTAAEYAMILALLVAAMIAAITAVGNSTLELWTGDANQITSAIRR